MLWIWIHLKLLPKIVFIKLPESNRHQEGINLWFLELITFFSVHHFSKEVIAIATLSKGEFRKKMTNTSWAPSSLIRARWCQDT